MDRRQQKTRYAIFNAFTALLAQKDFHQITVQEIIDTANVGRATFYAHFETKDYLLKALCEELFDHIIQSAMGHTDAHTHLFDCDAPDSVFLHLLQHLQKNDNHILELLSCQNNELFLQYFKTGLKKLIHAQYVLPGRLNTTALPEDFWVNHMASAFVETVIWWLRHDLAQPPETIAGYFLTAVEPALICEGGHSL